MLRDSLPEIVTGSVPGAKAKALLDRRGEAVPKVCVEVVTQSVWQEGKVPCLRM